MTSAAAAASHQPGTVFDFGNTSKVLLPSASTSSLAAIFPQRPSGTSGVKPCSFSRSWRSNSLSFKFIRRNLTNFCLKPATSPGQLRLGGAFADLQRLCYFLMRISLNGIHIEHQAIPYRKRTDNGEQVFAIQRINADVVRVAICLGQFGNLNRTPIFTVRGYSRIYHHTAYPTFKGSVAAKAVDLREYFDKSGL